MIYNNFIKRINNWKNINIENFLNHKWQNINTIQNKENLYEFIEKINIKNKNIILEQVSNGIKRSPMSIKISPYILSIINWDDFFNCPIRKQFIPINKEIIDDHPITKLDSLNEQIDSPVQGLVHRYPNKVLFLSISICPVYCRFCTRSYSIGNNTENINKITMKPTLKRWNQMFEYIKENKNIEDVVISGGDSYTLNPNMLDIIGKTLLNIEHIKRIRFATKGLAVLPMKILSDIEWTNKIIEISNYGRNLGKQVSIHTHFNHYKEITDITERACLYLFKNNIIIRNQTVLMRGINDDTYSMLLLIKRLNDINIFPYYVYQHDLVKGTEYFRTPLKTILDLEKNIRGYTSGFCIPNFVVDTMNGGGKRLASTYEYYDKKTGISIFDSPVINKIKGIDKKYYHVDPLQDLDEDNKNKWLNNKNSILQKYNYFIN